MRDIRRSFFTKFIDICMETPCCCPSGGAPTWRPETNRNICQSFVTKAYIYLSRKSKTRKKTFSKTRNVQIAKYPRNKSLFNQLGRHENAASRKSSEIQTSSITKPRTHSKQKFVWILVFCCSYASLK